MPEISRFYGIVIRMFFDDHNPPHFHAIYGDYEVLIDINILAVFAGHIPPRALWLSTLVHKYTNVFLIYAASRYESTGLLFILHIRRLRSLRVNFHSKGFAISS